MVGPSQMPSNYLSRTDHNTCDAQGLQNKENTTSSKGSRSNNDRVVALTEYAQ